MTRQERKDAARAALAELWAAGWKYDDVAEALGIDRRRVSELNSGSGRAPKHPMVWRLQELANPELDRQVREKVARVEEGLAELRQLDRVLAEAARAHGWEAG